MIHGLLRDRKWRSCDHLVDTRSAQLTPGPAPEGFWRCREWSLGPAASPNPTFVAPFLTRLVAASAARTAAPAQPGRRPQSRGPENLGQKWTGLSALCLPNPV